MKSSNRLWPLCVCILAAVLGALWARAADFFNGGFETGSFEGWTKKGGYWCGDTNYPDPAEYVFTDSPYQSAIVMTRQCSLPGGHGRNR